MSDRTSEDTSRDRATLRLLDRLARQADTAADAAETADPAAEIDALLAELGVEEAERLKADLEVLGLLPWSHETVVPAPEVKDRILAGIASADVEATGARSSGGPAPTAEDAEGARLLTYPPPADHSGPTRWLMPLAASAILAMAAVTGWLVVRVERQHAEIVQLSEDLSRAREATAALASSEGLLRDLKARLAMATRPGAQYCALKAPEGAPAPGAHATLVMHAADSNWFLRAEGLEPCDQGRRYVIWFVTDEGKVPAAIFQVKAGGAPVEVLGSGRPAGIGAVMITLEADETPNEPTGEPVLYGDERMQLL